MEPGGTQAMKHAAQGVACPHHPGSQPGRGRMSVSRGGRAVSGCSTLRDTFGRAAAGLAAGWDVFDTTSRK
jgi:hypothetical protein